MAMYKRKLKGGGEKLKVGTKVRISVEKSKFEPGYTRRWKSEIFEIAVVKRTFPVTYVLKDRKQERIGGVFYRQEIQPVAE
jgi:hypothetical protein